MFGSSGWPDANDDGALFHCAHAQDAHLRLDDHRRLEAAAPVP
jgi:hypothetical protein